MCVCMCRVVKGHDSSEEEHKEVRRLRLHMTVHSDLYFGTLALIRCLLWCDLSRAELQSGGSRPGTNEVNLVGGNM